MRGNPQMMLAQSKASWRLKSLHESLVCIRMQGQSCGNYCDSDATVSQASRFAVCVALIPSSGGRQTETASLCNHIFLSRLSFAFQFRSPKA